MGFKTGLKYGRAFGISQFTVLFVNFVNFEQINRALAIFSHWTDVIVISRHVAHVWQVLNISTLKKIRNCWESRTVADMHLSFSACVPLNSNLTDGIVFRNDTEFGTEIDYMFVCNRGFVLNGSSHVTCKDGVYNDSAPECLPKGKLLNKLYT